MSLVTRVLAWHLILSSALVDTAESPAEQRDDKEGKNKEAFFFFPPSVLLLDGPSLNQRVWRILRQAWAPEGQVVPPPTSLVVASTYPGWK